MAARTSSCEHISPEGKAEETIYTGVVSGQNSRINCLQMPQGVVVGAGTSLLAEVWNQKERRILIDLRMDRPGDSNGEEFAGSITLRESRYPGENRQEATVGMIRAACEHVLSLSRRALNTDQCFGKGGSFGTNTST